jgi:phosphate transport system ATP-binding protein
MSTISYSTILSQRSRHGRRPVVGQGGRPKCSARDVSFWYGDRQALDGVTLAIPERSVTALIGPSGCGKSTFLRLFNRLNDLIPGVRRSGEVLLDGLHVYRPGVDLVELRRRVGMVFQKSTAFPRSVFENVVFGPRVAGVRRRGDLEAICERCLKAAALWDEVKGRLNESAASLSAGQQQRLCIARALATDPEVLLLDEPASALDPASTVHVEDLLFELKKEHTIVLVTHNVQQAARVSDQTAFFFQGRLIESGPTDELFLRPRCERTEDYVTGRFG